MGKDLCLLNYNVQHSLWQSSNTQIKTTPDYKWKTHLPETYPCSMTCNLFPQLQNLPLPQTSLDPAWCRWCPLGHPPDIACLLPSKWPMMPGPLYQWQTTAPSISGTPTQWLTSVPLLPTWTGRQMALFGMHPLGPLNPIIYPQGKHDKNNAQIPVTPMHHDGTLDGLGGNPNGIRVSRHWQQGAPTTTAPNTTTAMSWVGPAVSRTTIGHMGKCK